MDKKLASTSVGKPLISAPMLTTLHLIAVILLRGWLPLPFPFPAFVYWVGLILAALGFVLGLLALLEIRRSRSGPAMKARTTGLVVTGIYRYTRNPVYLGFVSMLMGLGLSMGTYWGIFLGWSLIAMLNNLVIKPEEGHLEKRFGTQFVQYKSKVRRWL